MCETISKEERAINTLIRILPDKSQISDGYHTFEELYKHRNTLYVKLAEFAQKNNIYVWKSKTQSDGQSYGGFFLLGIGTARGNQLTYHLPIEFWDETPFALALDKAPRIRWTYV